MNREELKKKSILGTLKGVCADFIVPTRNGRKYTNKLWSKVFNSDLVKEQIENGGIFGEFGHPTDRDETLPEKIAICMPELPKTNKKGQYEATFDILDTPCGRILKTLIDYGYKIGISSRGTGDIVEDAQGNEIVDEDTYDFKAFDAVLIPAVKSARLSVVESLNTKKSLHESLRESLDNANEEERKVMKETLDDLGIDITEKCDEEKDYSPEMVDNIDKKEDSEKVEIEETEVKTEEACDTRLEEVISSLQEALKKNVELEKQILTLQNDLAVSDTKVTKVNEELSKYKEATARLSTSLSESNKLSEKVSKLQEELVRQKKLVVEKDSKISQLTESKNNELKESKKLNESINAKETQISSLKESLNELKINSEKEINKLTEQLENEKADSEIKNKEFEKKLNETFNKLKLYKKTVNETISRYIDSKASMLGVSKNRIINELEDSYSIDDIDKICESLQEELININKLPFTIKPNSKVRVTESKNDLISNEIDKDILGDDVDDGLIRLAGLK